MTGFRKALVAGAFLASTLVASSAWAEPTPQEKERARDLMAEGREKRDKNDLAGAVESFKQADAIMHVPTTSFELARTQQLLGQLVEARETAVNIGKQPVSPTDPPPFAEARAKAEALVKELDKQIPQLRITIKGDAKPTPAVTIDDVPAASLDAARVNPGKHVVVARADGAEARQEVTVAAGETKSVELTLGGGSSSDVATSTTGKKPFLPTLSVIGFGVGAAGLVVGTVTGIMAMSAEGDIADRCPNKRCLPGVQEDLDSAKTTATISTIGFVVAGVGVAVGVVGLFLPAKTETKVGSVTFDFTRMRGTF